MSSCDGHRDFLSALADDELDLVPPETVAHAQTCPECGREVETQRRLTRTLARAAKLRGAEEPASRRQRSRPGWAVAAVSAALVVTAVAGTLGWRALQGPDQVATAVSVAGQPLQLQSTDGAAIRSWCEREAERPVPEITSPSLEPTGARMDRRGNAEIVTVTYVTAEHRRIRVSWLDARLLSPSARSVQTRYVSGSTVLLVASGGGTAVVSGDAPLTSLWEVAARIQSTTGPNYRDRAGTRRSGLTIT
jgi:hypothetical protein